MFDGMRSKLSKRLGILMDRFTDIEKRAKVKIDEVEFAVRAGLGTGGNFEILDEIAVKSRQQGDVSGQAIQELLMHRALPLIFARSVTKAERFADMCEQLLDSFDLAEQAGKRAFRARFGIDE